MYRNIHSGLFKIPSFFLFMDSTIETNFCDKNIDLEKKLKLPKWILILRKAYEKYLKENENKIK
jgi:hypothetical protein